MNPLFELDDPVPFDRIRPEHLVPAAEEAVADARARIDAIKAESAAHFEPTFGVFDDAMERLHRVMVIAGHLNSVAHSDAVEEAYRDVVRLSSEFSSAISTDPDLLATFERVLEEDGEMRADQKRFATLTVESLRRSGAGLDPDPRSRLRELRVRLSDLQNEFGVNTLKATNATRFHLTDGSDLDGLPERHRAAARRRAEEAGEEGWLVTLQQPSAGPFLQHAHDRELRRRIHEARTNLAVSPPHDNRGILQEILELRAEIAGILGRETWAEHVLEESMAKTPQAVLDFIEQLTGATDPGWEQDRAALEALAGELGYERVEPWDMAFLSERLRERECAIEDEEVRPYFELGAVIDGAFEVARRLFGVELRPAALPAWHADVRTYEVLREGEVVAHLYADWHPRDDKRSGAWMNRLRAGGPRQDGTVEPHSVLVCGNFTAPDDEGRSLLNHDEVTTLFHEFGHALHQCLSTTRIRGLSGTSVYTDWVEVPSQIMENWCWEPEALALFAAHVETGELMPDELVERLRATRHHLEAAARMRQLSFAALDMALHAGPVAEDYEGTLRRAQRAAERYTLRPEFARNQFITGFHHLFSGMYSAGYYSYLWSDTLQTDLFTAFEDDRLFDRETGDRLVREILSRGNEAEPIDMFRSFMGRDPDYTALVRREGQAASAALAGGGPAGG
jgi:Zn-dependent oligopeptidase